MYLHLPENRTVYHVIPTLVVGGAQQALKTLIDHSDSFDHQIFFLSENPASIWTSNYCYKKVSMLTLARTLQKLKNKVACVHFHWFPPFAIDLTFLKQLNIPLLVSIQDTNLCTIKNADLYIVSREDALHFSPEAEKTTVCPPALDTGVWKNQRIERVKGRLVRHSTLYKSKLCLTDLDDILSYDAHKYQWTIIGVGDESYIKKIRKKVDHTPHVSYLQVQDICSKLNQNWLYVYHCADSYEQFGLCFQEALASGLPVVTNDLGGGKKQIQQSKTGFVCKSLKEMKETVDQIYHDPFLYKDLCKNVLKLNFENALRDYIKFHTNIYKGIVSLSDIL